MTEAFRRRRMLAFPDEGGSPGRPARLQRAALPAETTHGTLSTFEYYTQKTRMPRSCSDSVSERFSLQRLRPLFSAVPTLGRPQPPCTLSRAKPLRGPLGFEVSCPSGSCVISHAVGWLTGGEGSRSIPGSSGKGWPASARVCAGLAG